MYRVHTPHGNESFCFSTLEAAEGMAEAIINSTPQPIDPRNEEVVYITYFTASDCAVNCVSKSR